MIPLILLKSSGTPYGLTEYYDVFAQRYGDFILVVSRVMICWWICVSMVFTFFLSAKCMRIMYFHVISVFVVIASGWINVHTLKTLSAKYEQFEIDPVQELIIWERDGIVNDLMVQRIVDIVFVIFCNFILQLSLSMAFEYFQKYTENYLKYRISSSCFAIPTMFTFIPSTCNALHIISVLLTLCPLCKMLFLNISFTVIRIISNALKIVTHYLMKLILNIISMFYVYIREFGMRSLICKVWKRLEMPAVLRIFWVLRVIEKILNSSENTEMANQTAYDIITYLITDGCDAFITFSGLMSYLSYFRHHLETLVQRVLQTNVQGDRNIDVVSTVFFYLLALISELTDLEPDERLTQLFQNVIIVWAILLNYIYRKCYSVLVLVFYPNNKKNIRAVTVCGFIILSAVTILTHLWFYHSLSRFLLLIFTLNIQIILKVLVSLIIHTLLVLDASSLSFWIDVDDYVFCIQTFESVVYFGLNILIFLVIAYAKWWCDIHSIILAILLSSHFYKNIWCKVREEWKCFVIRQSAVKKTQSMLDATSEQLTKYDNFCAICYETMDVAKITNCNHYFHGICLRKWLYVNIYCPMCLQKLFNVT